MGGIAKRVSWIRQAKKEKKDAVIVDAGNSFAGIYGVDKEGKARAAFLFKKYGQMGYSVVALGTKDLDLPLDFLKKEEKENKIPLVCANVYKDLKRVFAPYVIREMSGMKVAFIGVVDNSATKYRPKKDFVIEDPKMELMQLKDEIKKKGVDLVVLLTDIPVVSLKRMLPDLDWVDVAILSGRGSAFRNPLEVGATSILSPIPKGKGIGIAKIEFSPKGDVVDIKNVLVLLKKGVPQDETVAEEVKKLLASFPKHNVRTVKNPFLKALEEARKRRQKAQNGATSQSSSKAGTNTTTGTNPFLEIFKKGQGKGGTAQAH